MKIGERIIRTINLLNFEYINGGITMFKFIIILFVGTIISLFLYACVVVGKQSDEIIEEMEKHNE